MAAQMDMTQSRGRGHDSRPPWMLLSQQVATPLCEQGRQRRAAPGQLWLEKPVPTRMPA